LKAKVVSTLSNVIILAAAVFLVGVCNAEGQESLLTRLYDLGKDRSLELQYYNMDVEIITRASDGSRANVETYSMRLMVKPGDFSAGMPDRWTCTWFALKIGEGPEVNIPALRQWSYDFNQGVGIDDHGQVLGIPHAKFENLTDNKGNKLDAVVAYQVYNQFVQFHTYVDGIAAPAPDGGEGVQDLRSIGDRTVLDEFSEDLPLSVGLIVKEGSVFRPGAEALEFKGLSVIDGSPCALLGVDGGEGSFTMIIEVMPNVNATTVGGTRFFGDIYVDIESMWLKKAEITVVDVTETSIGGAVVANTTLESHYRIRAVMKEK
jgi:hypothetical protein